ncbi:MAG: hypothetical protein IKM83_00510 [Paludibacteraceae bacterium]|nr:hypothetical protein [Paludibacteraceae bacterium]
MKARLLPILCMVLAFVACEPNEPTQKPKFELNTPSLSMYVGDMRHLKIDSDLEYTVKSEDLYVASIYGENNTVKAEHVGKTTISISNGNETLTCEVEVLAKYHPFEEPFIPNYTAPTCHWLTMGNYNDSHGFEYIESASTSECHVYKGKEPNVYFFYFFDYSLNITQLQMRFFDMSLWQSLYQYTIERFQLVSGKVLGSDGHGDYYYEDIFCNSLNASTSTLDITLGNNYVVGTDPCIALIFVPKQ